MMLLPLLAGALFPLAFSPVDQAWLAPLSLVGLLLSWQQATAKQAFWRGLLWGFAAFVIGVSWIHVAVREFGQAPLALSLFLTGGLVAVLAVFPALTGTLLVKYFSAPLPRLLAFAPLWVLTEFLRGHVFTGFPWLFAGASQTDTWLMHLLPVLGVYGGSLAVALAASLLLLLIQPATGRRRIVRLLVAPLLMLPFVAPLSRSNLAVATSPQLSVALVQANIAQSLKWQPEQLQFITAQYRELTTPLLGQVDVIIWPEAAIPSFPHHLGNYFPELDRDAKAQGTALVTGLPLLDHDNRYFNGVVGLGTASGRYDKRHLVPFGEYVPFQSLLRGMFQFFNLPMSGFSEGEQPALLEVAGQPMAAAICYEIAYPELVRDNVSQLQQRPGYLLTVSNDAWFGASWGPWQHLQIARVRAIENGLPVIRATVTGVSAVIAPDGRISQQLPQFETAVLRTTVAARKPDTLWLQFGLWPVSILVALLLLVAGWRQRRKSVS